jgi:Phosphatase
VNAPSVDELRQQLQDARIAGDVATPRDDNLAKYAMFSRRLARANFGLETSRHWSVPDVVELMARMVGVSADPGRRAGRDRIDPDLTIDALKRMATHLAASAGPGRRVIVATGHPAGLLAVHLPIARALVAAGTEILTPARGWSYELGTHNGQVTREIRYVGDVAMLSTRGELNHTHSPRPMEAMLADLIATDVGLPDLVIADHGWAGAAGQAGITTVGFADTNDPALFVGELEGKVAVAVPLDDNVAPHLYAPMTAFLLHAAGLG